jgi:hypothetical protein
MASRSGADTPIVAGLCSTFGTPVSAVAGGLLFANSFNQNRNVTALRSNPIGSGNHMDGLDTQIGQDSPTINIDKDLHFNDAGNIFLAQFFGTAATPMTMAAGAYSQSLIYNETINAKYVTVATSPTTTETMEWPSVAVRSVNVTGSQYGPVIAAFEGISNERRITGTLNGVGGTGAATIANAKRVILKQADYFLINAQAGAAFSTATDAVAIKSFSIAYQRPQEHVFEVRGAAGNAATVPTGDPPFKVTLTVTLRDLAAFTYFTALAAGTAYKAELRITGDLITGSTYYGCSFFFPYLKILEDPQHNLTSAGTNEHVIVMEALMASAAPTGMISTYPYVILLNDRATSYLA